MHAPLFLLSQVSKGIYEENYAHECDLVQHNSYNYFQLNYFSEVENDESLMEIASQIFKNLQQLNFYKVKACEELPSKLVLSGYDKCE